MHTHGIKSLPFLSIKKSRCPFFNGRLGSRSICKVMFSESTLEGSYIWLLSFWSKVGNYVCHSMCEFNRLYEVKYANLNFQNYRWICVMLTYSVRLCQVYFWRLFFQKVSLHFNLIFFWVLLLCNTRLANILNPIWLSKWYDMFLLANKKLYYRFIKSEPKKIIPHQTNLV